MFAVFGAREVCGQAFDVLHESARCLCDLLDFHVVEHAALLFCLGFRMLGGLGAGRVSAFLFRNEKSLSHLLNLLDFFSIKVGLKALVDF